MDKLIIRTLGGFDIIYGNKSLSDFPVRRSKMWLVLKYIIAHHRRSVPADEIINLLWPDESCINPSASLNNMICKLRKIFLDYFGITQCIHYSDGRYSWKPMIKCSFDTIELEKYIAEAKNESNKYEERIKYYQKSIALYKSDFLRGERNELWLMNFVNYYRRLFFNAIDELAELYEQQAALEKAAQVYADALKIESYEEVLFIKLIRLLIYLGEYGLADKQYKIIEKILKNEFNAKPCEELLNLHREIKSYEKEQTIDIFDVKSQFEKNVVKKTALICGPETFKRIYCYDKHLDERMQFPVFLAMVTIQVSDDSLLKTNSMRSQMKILRDIILTVLRQCDIVCQYSPNQFILMLTATDEKNKTAPLIRIQNLFHKESKIEGVSIHTQAVAMKDEKITASS